MKSYFTTTSFVAVCITISILLSSCSEGEPSPFLGEPAVVTNGFQFTEGPLWHPDGFLLFSDIPANTVYKWTPGSDQSEIYIQPSGNSNGIKSLSDGTLILAQHTGRVSLVSENNELQPIAEQYEGKRLNSPNDIAVRSDDLIYFTDPIFGVSEENRELDIRGVYRINEDRSLTLMYDEFDLPNGIVFSPDEDFLYVNNSATGNIMRFNVLQNGDIENATLFANIGEMTEMGGADGMVTDDDGYLYTTGPNGLIILDPDGNQIYQLEFDHQVTNLAWENGKNEALYLTSPNDIYRIPVNK